MADLTHSYFFLYKDANKQWRWNFRAKNHRIIADSAEGYINRQDAIHGITLLKGNAASSSVYDDQEKAWL